MDGRLPGRREATGRQNPAYSPTRLPPPAVLPLEGPLTRVGGPQQATPTADVRVCTTAANLVNEPAEAAGDKRLCRTVVDRLTFEAHIIETGTQSFRLAGTTAKRRTAAA